MLFTQLLFAYYFPRKIEGKLMYYVIPIVLTLIPSIYVLLVKNSVIDSVVHYPDSFISVAKMNLITGYIHCRMF